MTTTVFDPLSLYDIGPQIRSHDHRNHQDCFTMPILKPIKQISLTRLGYQLTTWFFFLNRVSSMVHCKTLSYLLRHAVYAQQMLLFLVDKGSRTRHQLWGMVINRQSKQLFGLCVLHTYVCVCVCVNKHNLSLCLQHISMCERVWSPLTEVQGCGGKLCPPVVIKHAGLSAEPDLPSDQWIIAQSEATKSLKWLQRVCPVSASPRKAWSTAEKRNHKCKDYLHSEGLKKPWLC